MAASNEVRLYEAGNGFRGVKVGAEIAGLDDLLVVESVSSTILTGRPGQGNYVHAVVRSSERSLTDLTDEEFEALPEVRVEPMPEISDEQIEALLDAAGEHGDTEMVAVCRVALGYGADPRDHESPDPTPSEVATARAECERAIRDAQAMVD